MSILGMISGKTFSDNNFLSLNDRRKVFHQYPNGAFPLTGLASIMETENTDNTDFGWFEKRYRSIMTQLTAPDSVAPFSATGGDTALTSPANLSQHTVYRIKVADSSEFRPSMVVMVQNVPLDGGGTANIKGVVTSIPDTTRIEIRLVEAYTDVLNTTNTTTGGTAGPVDAYVIVIGTANQEGGTATGNARLIVPCNPSNLTQIFKTPFSFSNTALQIPAVFDKTGIYKERAKDACVEHVTDIEKALIFGARSITTETAADGEVVPVRTMGGLIWFIEQWEAANSIYRGGTGAPAVTLDSDPLKRIINNPTGTMTKAVFNGYIERLFRVTNNKSYEKLCICGAGVITTINELIESRIVINKNMPAESTFGMNVVTVETPHGIIHFKTHPLLTENPFYYSTAIFVDVQNFRFRPLNKRDTKLYKNRQGNGEDRRREEWLTEGSGEFRFPESNMVIHNFNAVTLS